MAMRMDSARELPVQIEDTDISVIKVGWNSTVTTPWKKYFSPYRYRAVAEREVASFITRGAESKEQHRKPSSRDQSDCQFVYANQQPEETQREGAERCRTSDGSGGRRCTEAKAEASKKEG